MYGYLKVDKLELKYKEYSVYRKYYCAVCNSLRENLSKKWCLLTSYDATFFLMLFDSVLEDKETMKLLCPLNPLHKTNSIHISKHAIEYTAFISLFYYYSKLKDNVIDENKNKYKRKLRRLYKNSRCNQLFSSNKIIYDSLDNILSEYFRMEEINSYFFDDYCDKMGELFGTAFREFLPNNHDNKNEFFKIGYNLGKWIYVVDAFDDLQEDIKTNSFNPILHMQDYESLNNEALSDKILFISKCLAKNIYCELEKISIVNNKGIIYNIILLGMNNAIFNIIKVKYRGENNVWQCNNRK